MMTVRETVVFLPKVDHLNLSYDGMAYPFDADNAFHMAAFGDFDVAKVLEGGSTRPNEKVFELVIACKPLKNGVPV